MEATAFPFKPVKPELARVRSPRSIDEISVGLNVVVAQPHRGVSLASGPKVIVPSTNFGAATRLD